MKFEVFVTVTTEKTYAFEVDADDTQDAAFEARDALEGADVSEIYGVREVTGWTWLFEEIDRIVPGREVDPCAGCNAFPIDITQGDLCDSCTFESGVSARTLYEE